VFLATRGLTNAQTNSPVGQSVRHSDKARDFEDSRRNKYQSNGFGAFQKYYLNISSTSTVSRSDSLARPHFGKTVVREVAQIVVEGLEVPAVNRGSFVPHDQLSLPQQLCGGPP
jgi:hypothetical protein